MNWPKTLLLGVVAISAILALSDKPKPPEKNLFFYLQDFPEILELVDKAYVDEVDWDILMPGAFQGILETVDPNASYIPPAETVESELDAFQNIGMHVAKRRSYGYVMAVPPGSRARAAGVRSGDFIRQIDGQSTRRMSLHQIRRQLNRQVPEITLLLASENDFEGRTVVMTPGPSPIPKAASIAHESGVLELSIPALYDQLEEDLQRMLSVDNRGFSTILIDLRENASTDDDLLRIFARLFLPKGVIIQTAKDAEKSVPLMNPLDGMCADVPLFLLLDRSTAGWAELFCAVAQDVNRAELLGEATLGYPFLYQRIDLKNGAQIELPTTKILLPSGSQYFKKGLKPDVTIDRPKEAENDDPVKRQALEYVSKFLKNEKAA